MMALFDSHCHVDEPKFDDDRADVLTRMAEAGVTRYAVIGSDMATSRHSADFAAAHLGCYAAIGIHPHEAKGFVEDDLQRLADWSKEEKVVAIGEIGLDYYYDLSPRETQMTVCEAQMELAWELSLPVAYHIRDAPGYSIGGDKFGNYEGLLPDASGRKWYEADANYTVGPRGAERILYSSDGLVYYTNDHYQTFTEMHPSGK